MSSPGFHEDDPVDKSYDHALLWRLLRYLRPYKLPVAVSFLLIVVMVARPQGLLGRPRVEIV